MKFLLDANIPPSLAEELAGFEVFTSQSLPKGNASKDSEIIQFTIENEVILITKDFDFYHSFLQGRKPRKLILVKLGNMKIRELRSCFRKNLPKIKELFEKASMIILTPDEILTFE
jgi:predicted nuclease of predicted toxin-antitoxin system